MKMISQIQAQHVPFLNGHAPSLSTKRLSHGWTVGWEIVEEACEAIAGVFAMPFRRVPYDQNLQQLGGHLLEDIGYETTKKKPS